MIIEPFQGDAERCGENRPDEIIGGFKESPAPEMPYLVSIHDDFRARAYPVTPELFKRVRRVKKLFDSRDNGPGRNSFEAWHVMAGLWLNGRVKIKPHRVDQRLLDEADRESARHHSFSRAEGGLSHCWLKEIGIRWLRSHYDGVGVEIHREFQWGYTYDLATSTGGTVLECGNTNIMACLTALFDDRRAYFLLPFSRAADRWYEEDGRPNIYVYEFTTLPPSPPLQVRA